MTLRSVVPTLSKERLCVLCWAWVVALGSSLVVWNLQAGHPARAKVVGLVMVLGSAVYVADMLSSVYRQTEQAH